MAFFQQFFSTSYWFGSIPAIAEGAGRFVIGLFAAFVLVGFILLLAVRRRVSERLLSALIRRIARLLISMGAFGLILAFFSYENARFFGDRFWYGIWLVLTVAWAGWLVWYGLKELPRLRAAAIEKREKEKYLP